MADAGYSVRRVRRHSADTQERILTGRFGASSSDSRPSQVSLLPTLEQQHMADRSSPLLEVPKPRELGFNDRDVTPAFGLVALAGTRVAVVALESDSKG